MNPDYKILKENLDFELLFSYEICKNDINTFIFYESTVLYPTIFTNINKS